MGIIKLTGTKLATWLYIFFNHLSHHFSLFLFYFQTVDHDSFVNTFKNNWLKYFICSYQYLEYRVAKLISQVKLDLISRKIICETYINVLISTVTTSEEKEANLIRIICSCWNETENKNMVSADEWNEHLIEFQQPESEVCKDDVQINEQGNQVTANKQKDKYNNIQIQFNSNSEKAEEDAILRANFLSSKDVLEFYNFLPKVTAQPLWIMWIEVQKILLMQKYCNWFSSERLAVNSFFLVCFKTF